MLIVDILNSRKHKKTLLLRRVPKECLDDSVKIRLTQITCIAQPDEVVAGRTASEAILLRHRLFAGACADLDCVAYLMH